MLSKKRTGSHKTHPERKRELSAEIEELRADLGASEEKRISPMLSVSARRRRQSAGDSLHATPVYKEGWLLKLGGVRKNWHLRWFVLDSAAQTFSYFRNPDQDTSLGVAKLCKNTTVSESVEGFEHVAHCFLVSCPNKTNRRPNYVVAAVDGTDCADWKNAFRRVSGCAKLTAYSSGSCGTSMLTSFDEGRAPSRAKSVCWRSEGFLRVHYTDRTRMIASGNGDMLEVTEDGNMQGVHSHKAARHGERDNHKQAMRTSIDYFGCVKSDIPDVNAEEELDLKVADEKEEKSGLYVRQSSMYIKRSKAEVLDDEALVGASIAKYASRPQQRKNPRLPTSAQPVMPDISEPALPSSAPPAMATATPPPQPSLPTSARPALPSLPSPALPRTASPALASMRAADSSAGADSTASIAPFERLKNGGGARGPPPSLPTSLSPSLNEARSEATLPDQISPDDFLNMFHKSESTLKPFN